MQFKLLFLAASAALVSATAPTTQCTDACNPIAKPGLGDIVPVSIPYTITWNPTTTGTVSIQLLQGPSSNVVALGPQLVSGYANSGTYSWTPSTSLVPGTTGYGLQIINDADGTFQYSVQFGISNPSYSSASASSAPASSAAAGSASSTAVSSASAPSTMALTYASTGAPAANSSIILPTVPLSVPSTLSAAATSSASGSSSASTATTATTSAKASSGASPLGVSFGGAVAALIAFAL